MRQVRQQARRSKLSRRRVLDDRDGPGDPGPDPASVQPWGDLSELAGGAGGGGGLPRKRGGGGEAGGKGEGVSQDVSSTRMQGGPAASALPLAGSRQRTTAAERYGIFSFVYSRRRPFHPQVVAAPPFSSPRHDPLVSDVR